MAISLADGRSKSTYLHASFGAGKTAVMSVLQLLLQGDPTARSISELAPIVARYTDRIDGRRFLLVPYHFVGRTRWSRWGSCGYVEHMLRLHPGTPLPPKGCLEDRCSLEASSTAPRAGLAWLRPERFRTPLQLASYCPETPAPSRLRAGGEVLSGNSSVR